MPSLLKIAKVALAFRGPFPTRIRCTLIKFAIPGLSEAECAILARSRTYRLYVLNRERLFAKRCPFCGEQDPAEVIASNTYWWAKLNPSPEKNVRIHILIIPRWHFKGIMDLHGEMEGDLEIDFFRILRQVYGLYNITAAGILTRDGDATQLAGTVEHAHWHVMVPNGQGRVETPIAKGDADEEAGRERAIIYEQLFQGTLRPEDFSEAQNALVDAKRLEGYVAPTA